MATSPPDYYDHPVFHPERLVLETPAIKQLGEKIRHWLWTGATGGYVLGRSRVGKTKALKILPPRLHTRGNVQIPAYYVSTPSRDQKTISSVFRQMCLSADLKVSHRDIADHLSDRFVHYIADKAVETGCSQAVLFVDEMQRLSPWQLNAFAEVYDKVRLLDIALVVVFVGDDVESSHLLSEIEKPNNAHIRGRFFTQGLTFRGLTSKAEVQECLAQYDTLCFPEDGPTYTAFFLPEAVREEWQLASLSSDLWQVFREYQSTYKIGSWGMQYFCATANTLLVDYLPQFGVEAVDEKMIRECILASGLLPSLVTASA